ncbi:MAG: ABC transporter ATP-binding protein [Flavobacteriales bacterium]
MELILENLGKKYEGNWIFRNVNLSLPSGSRLLITGKNGSGKSTLAKTIAGLILPSEGKILYKTQSSVLPEEIAYKSIQLSGPYIDLVEDFTLEEFLNFHAKFKSFQLPINELIELGYFVEHRTKYIRNFSSGMKQRVKLLVSLLSDVPFTILDEPTANLDERGTLWYHELVERFASTKTIVVCSNSPLVDAQFCTQSLNIEDYIVAK